MQQPIQDLEVPAGYVHRADLIERGWTSPMVDRHLSTLAVRIEVPTHLAGKVSNKVYPAGEVDRVEQEVAEVRRAVHAGDDLVPRTPGGFTPGQDPTISRRQLLDRGWTAAHITRLLGDPDAISPGIQGDAHLYDARRVAQAEADDAKLIKRLATVRAKATQARQAEIDAAVDAGQVVYRRHGDGWALQATTLTPGSVVTVTKRDGTTAQRVVGAIISSTGPQTLAADAGEPRRPAARPGVPATHDVVPRRSHAAAPATAAAPQPRAMVLTAMRVGETHRIGATIGVVLHVSTTTVSEDDPSVWGSHLLGHEGRRAWIVIHRPATVDEQAPILQAEARQD